VRLDLWGGTSGTFNGLDQFNRVTDQRWQNGTGGTPADIDRYQYGYDLNSNRLYKANVVGTPIVTGGLDEFYTYDHLNRLTDMQRGTLNGTNTGITGTPTVEQAWSLDPTGNWSGFVTAASGATDLDQTRTSNTVNEITNITESTGPTWVVPAYDPNGNMSALPQVADPTQGFIAVYDAWNRLITITDAGTSETVAIYSYDGRNRRNYKITYSGGVPVEGRTFYFTNNWQNIEERTGTSTSMDKQYVWGIRYIDELVCRDDATPQRLYACQDANFNLTSITDTSGSVQERYLFDPYGNRTIMNNSWGIISSSSYTWVVGHQGLTHDVETTHTFARYRYLQPGLGRWTARDPIESVAMISIRASANVDEATLIALAAASERIRAAFGWASLFDRAVSLYADGANLYEAEYGNPISFTDPSGLSGGGGGSPYRVGGPKGAGTCCRAHGGKYDTLANNLYGGSAKDCWTACMGSFVPVAGMAGGGALGGVGSWLGSYIGGAAGGTIAGVSGGVGAAAIVAAAAGCSLACDATPGCSLDQTKF
jgi:RHS repeat-associated protein